MHPMVVRPSSADVPFSDSQKNRLSLWNVEILDFAISKRLGVPRPTRCSDLLAVVLLVSGHLVVLFIIIRIGWFVFFFFFLPVQDLDPGPCFSEISQKTAISSVDHCR